MPMLASLPLPVAIVAAAAGDERSCSTGTVSYVSFEPSLLAVPLAGRGRTAELARRSGELSVSLLDEGQAELAVRASRPGVGDKFAEQGIPVLEPPDGSAAPAVAGSSSVLWCRVVGEHPHGSALVFVAEVCTHIKGGGTPLLRYERRYHGLGAPVPVAEEADYPL
jgi:flavin reductase (DIM6/NTAB) family NADH-FMN oxidoreductase RutF